MRPDMYGSYHHITVLGKENAPCDHKYDVTGGLCENNDKFAIDRMLPKIDMGDILYIHDTGAHGHASEGGRQCGNDSQSRNTCRLFRNIGFYRLIEIN